MLHSRYLVPPIAEDLLKKMVFLAGPRQVGKSTLATGLIGPRFRKAVSYNWDNMQDRRMIRTADWPRDTGLVILDEIHKFGGWKRFIKGEHDVHKEQFRFLVTGSSRMDIYRRGGDSLQGRYHHYRLHPFSAREMLGHPPSIKPFRELEVGAILPADKMEALGTFGGFPEPLTAQSVRTLRRWHKERSERLFREDIRDVEDIREIGKMRLLGDMLLPRVGSLLSVNSLREDLEISHTAAARWVDILEAFYYHFRVHPHVPTPFRALRKEPKLYLWDWSEVENPGAKFENMVASHLLKLVHWFEDTEGFKAELRFVRDSAKREVDFLVVIDGRPWFMVEAKLSDTSIPSHFRHFVEVLHVPFAYQVVATSGMDKLSNGIRVISADRFLPALV